MTCIKLSLFGPVHHLIQVKDMGDSLRHSQSVRKEFAHDCCFA